MGKQDDTYSWGYSEGAKQAKEMGFASGGKVTVKAHERAPRMVKAPPKPMPTSKDTPTVNASGMARGGKAMPRNKMHHAHEAKGMANGGKWMKEAFANSHGQFKAKAKKAGMSTKSFAEKEKGAGGKTGRQANLAIQGMKASHKHAKGGKIKKDDCYADGGKVAKRDVHKHEKHMHPGKAETKLARGGMVKHMGPKKPSIHMGKPKMPMMIPPASPLPSAMPAGLAQVAAPSPDMGNGPMMNKGGKMAKRKSGKGC